MFCSSRASWQSIHHTCLVFAVLRIFVDRFLRRLRVSSPDPFPVSRTFAHLLRNVADVPPGISYVERVRGGGAGSFALNFRLLLVDYARFSPCKENIWRLRGIGELVSRLHLTSPPRSPPVRQKLRAARMERQLGAPARGQTNLGSRDTSLSRKRNSWAPLRVSP